MTYPPSEQFPSVDPNQPAAPSHSSASPEGTPPPNNLGWAIAGAFFVLPLALAAFFASSKVEVLWRLGDFAGAEKASADAKKFGSLALWIGLGLLVFTCVGYASVIGLAMSSLPSHS